MVEAGRQFEPSIEASATSAFGSRQQTKVVAAVLLTLEQMVEEAKPMRGQRQTPAQPIATDLQADCLQHSGLVITQRSFTSRPC